MPEHGDLISQLVAQTARLLQTEYPNGIRLDMNGPIAEPISPSAIYPSFYGCFDWHSSVHSHWQLVRASRVHPDGPFADGARTFLAASLTAANIEVEMAWVADRPNFEMPYGMAWLLTLSAELHTWQDTDSQSWKAALEPMERHATRQFEQYCGRLALPVRSGTHNQSAFSLGLVHDAATALGNADLAERVADAARRLYLDDRNINLAYEPSATDFLSPSLSEADLLSRTLETNQFAHWLTEFTPAGFDALTPVEVVDVSDGQLAHWAGLNVSRSWMLTRIADALPHDDERVESLRTNAATHAAVGLPVAADPDYMVSHWVPTFAIYLLTNCPAVTAS